MTLLSYVSHDHLSWVDGKARLFGQLGGMYSSHRTALLLLANGFISETRIVKLFAIL